MSTSSDTPGPAMKLGRVEPKRKADNETVVLSVPVTDDGTVRLGSDAPEDARPEETTVRLGSDTPQDARPEESTVRLDATTPDLTVDLGATEPDLTVKLGATEPDPTVKLGATEPELTVELPAGAEESTVRLPAGSAIEATSATFLDPEAWPAGQQQEQQPPEELRRFGPGVPPQAAAVWHGTAAAEPTPEPERRRRGRWLVLPLVALLGVAGYVGWERYGHPVAVSGVTVRTDAAGPSCDGTAVVTGTVETDGGAGTLTYHWLRSDGTDSGVLNQHVDSGHHSTELTLRWTFQGRGTFQGTATLEILTPIHRTAAVSFPYSCTN